MLRSGKRCMCTHWQPSERYGWNKAETSSTERSFHPRSTSKPKMATDNQAEMIGEQLSRMRDNLTARFERDEAELEHHEALNEEKFKAIWAAVNELQKARDDHESRLRGVNDQVINLKSSSTIVQAGQAMLSIILATIAAWLGSR